MNTQELRKLAMAATPEPWKVVDHVKDDGTRAYEIETGSVDGELQTCRYIVAANPQTIIALLDKIDQLQAERAALKKQEPVAISEGAELLWIADKMLDDDQDRYLYLSAGAQREPMTEKDALADKTLRYYFGLNSGKGPISEKGLRIIHAIEAHHDIGAKE